MQADRINKGIKMKKQKNDTKKLFRTIGACSSTYSYLLNRAFDNHNERAEQALGPLAGGINRLGYQCGMLWGASMAAGAEAYRRFDNLDKAIAVTIEATKLLMESFQKRANSIECSDITDCDWDSKMSMAKYFITGKFLGCFNLAEEWTEEAIETAEKSLGINESELPDKCVSCASEVIKKMGGTEKEMVMAAGFAGGLGLSGNACGALSAAIWKKNLLRTEKYTMHNQEAEEALEKFYEVTDYEILCEKIADKHFESVDDHTEYINNGGCEKLINTLGEL